MIRLIYKVNSLSGRMGRRFLFLMCIVLVLMIGGVRDVIGPEYSLSLFFLFPIIVATWNEGRNAGRVISFFSIFVWLIADISMLKTFSNPLIPYINGTFRLIVFLLATGLVWDFKNVLETQRKLARIDPLTGLSNRRAFFEKADAEMNRAKRFDYPLSIVYMDIDNFKTVNDNLGHDAGDHLLKVVADTVLKNVRNIDISVRFGGDELGILLSETDAAGAQKLAEKLNRKLKIKMREHDWPVTFSMGVATFQDITVKIEDMLNIADKLMYLAKKNGKNRILHQVITDKEPPVNRDNCYNMTAHILSPNNISSIL